MIRNPKWVVLHGINKKPHGSRVTKESRIVVRASRPVGIEDDPKEGHVAILPDSVSVPQGTVAAPQGVADYHGRQEEKVCHETNPEKFQ